MKSRRLLFRILLIVVLVAIAGVMMVIGRGHTVYFDNKTVEYQGTTYEAPYKIEIHVGNNADGDALSKLYENERASADQIGQKITVTLIVTQEKGGDEEAPVTYTIPLPYGMDGPIINLPAYLAGLPEEAYLSEFIPVVTEEPEETVVIDDGMGMGDF
ncbi:DUF6672 family protein [Flavonifractor sp. HCP28S3_F3]|uniref:DUF6672 family protein n=1 Tax=Flavonifractor sp. HCP28S3_F3 TaxID=3438939 RepID=UPI003F8A5BA3